MSNVENGFGLIGAGYRVAAPLFPSRERSNRPVFDMTCRHSPSAWIYAVFCIFVLGCEEDLASRDPFETPFSMFGVLSPDLDTQAVRVYPLEAFPTLGSAEPLDIEVSSIDLQTGERRTWKDTVLVDPNGQHEHVFWAPFRAEFGREYRIEAKRLSDRITSRADVRIPPRPTVRIDEVDAPLLHVMIEGDEIRALKPEAVYVVGVDRPAIQVNIDYHGTEMPMESGWKVTYNMIVDYDLIRFIVGGIPYCLGGLKLFELQLRVLVGDGAWDPPGGAFDPNVLAFARTMSNVENGFGFVGGGYRLRESLFPSQETVELACFDYVW